MRRNQLHLLTCHCANLMRLILELQISSSEARASSFASSGFWMGFRSFTSPLPPMFVRRQWLRILVVLSSLSASDALRPRTVISETTNSTNLLLPVIQDESSATASTLSSAKPIPQIIWPENSGTIEISSKPYNVSSPNTVTAGNPEYKCNGATYGRNLNFRSCMDAYYSIREYHSPQTFGERGQGRWDINLPFRFLSSGSPLLYESLNWNQSKLTSIR